MAVSRPSHLYNCWFLCVRKTTAQCHEDIRLENSDLCSSFDKTFHLLEFRLLLWKRKPQCFTRIAVRMQTLGQSKWTRICRAPNCQQVLIPELVCLTPVSECPVSWKGSRSSVWGSPSCRRWWAGGMLRSDWKLLAVVPKNRPFLSQVILSYLCSASKNCARWLKFQGSETSS